MTARLDPYLNFDGNAREAMEFYREVLGGELTLSTFGELGAEGIDPNKIMHAGLRTERDMMIMAADLPTGQPYTPSETISLSLTGDEDAVLREYWAKLSGGGTVVVPLEKQVWGDVFGMCKDRYGVNWLVNISSPS